ncbi:hypothetical protein B1757_14800 [Acidithiobacillus marinus]|uniref:Uncharacterized protein n=1 Tax=Acidithiobacillus marinus TaxID=187490 RepID=A0A2I1DHW1_9PROT|nr:hypothetical protein B1757_14800 [Acidithiobacillus marinus]
MQITTKVNEEVKTLAEARKLRQNLVLDAVIQVGLQELRLGDRYKLLDSGLLVSSQLEAANEPQARSETRSCTKRTKTQAAKRSPQTETTSTTQPPVNKPTSGKQQPEPQISTTQNPNPLTETTPTTQPPVSLRITQQLSREQIPADVYDQLSEYEKECLQYEAFVLDPEEGVILRSDPPVNSEGIRATASDWENMKSGFIEGDDPDLFGGIKW